MKLGRPKGIGKSKLDIYRVEIESLIKNRLTQKFIAKRYNTTEANLHHWLKQREVKVSLFYLLGAFPKNSLCDNNSGTPL